MFPVRATKTLVEASERGYSSFVCTCLQTQSMMELYQKLSKHPQKILHTMGKYLWRTWKLKRREDICLKGPYFQVTFLVLQFWRSKINVTPCKPANYNRATSKVCNHLIVQQLVTDTTYELDTTKKVLNSHKTLFLVRGSIWAPD